MKTVLMVAEKPSLAQSIAKFLSNGRMNSRKGLNGACSVHEYSGSFRNEPVKFKMTSVCGHVMSLDFHHKYNNWDAVDPLELFTATTLKKEATEKLQMPKFLSHEAKGVDYLVLWLDCDKEGENICFEVMECVRNSMNKRPGEQTVFRAKFSAITEKDIAGAMQKLGQPNKNESLSVDARQELDLRIGCAFTRFQTKYFQNKYGDLDSALISYGPCQTPTLGFCVERHDQIQSFKPEAYWVIKPKVVHSSGQSVVLDWDRVRVFDKEIALVFQKTIKESSNAQVTCISKTQKTKQRPQALNTVEMLRLASSGLGMGPQHTMQIAERLYTQGYISYPRTETTHYPENFDLKGALKQQSGSAMWGSHVRELLDGAMTKPRKGHDAGDHPPITPMRCASESELGGDPWRLYDFITRHFLATLSPDCKYLQTTVKFKIGKEAFSFTGKAVTDPGFTSVMTWQAISDDERMPPFNKGDICQVAEVKLDERQTLPPDFLTESELITLMEKHGIGTDASISVHINNICERNYVQIQSGRKLAPTSLGIVLVHGYQKIDPELVLPTMRSAVEEQLNLIAHGKADFNAVLHHAIGIFTQKFTYFVKTVSSMDELFEVSFTPLSESGKPLSRCGKCNRYMKYIAAKPSRLHCATCDETYSLPQNGSIKLYKELRCPLDDFELVLWSTGAKGKSTPVCPYCYSHPPFPTMRKGMGCNQCTHPTCPHSEEALGVADCLECEKGMLNLDPTSAPKWRLACNMCNVVIHMCEGAFRISLSEDECDCGSSKLDVDFNKANSPLPNNLTQHRGCPFCDPILVPLVRLQHAASRHPMYRGGRGRGGRGRGGRRRRGRGRGQPKDKMSQLAAYFV
ncbi:predicted protein [Nematostella vectensis]|uniref:DNA topoisomerase n=1 Tax=Nematostella vectensis TaxID=45351 RepID=A7RW77_NEMVE|nr:DNA topoisomerase 3-beta-1 [Nematostella vectensis]EDO44262.1 predicted protein [Nematostella vectensis]|eukprot:XP_001636325.1 predicted protein [Nematostella vectensis]